MIMYHTPGREMPARSLNSTHEVISTHSHVTPFCPSTRPSGFTTTTTLVVGFKVEPLVRLKYQTTYGGFEDFIQEVINRHMQSEGLQRRPFDQGHEEGFDQHQNKWTLKDDASIKADADDECKLPDTSSFMLRCIRTNHRTGGELSLCPRPW
jgi:hypothetical protein